MAIPTNLSIASVKYNGVSIPLVGSNATPTGAISVVDTQDSHGGTVRTITALDISDTTAVASDVASGKYFYTAAGVKTSGTGSGGSSVKTKTGTVSGSGNTVLQISCDFAPDFVYVFGDLSSSASFRGVVSIIIIKDTAIYQTVDGSQSTTQETLYDVGRNITGYNESQTSSAHASYSNGVFSIDCVDNTSACRFESGVSYSYQLVKWS